MLLSNYLLHLYLELICSSYTDVELLFLVSLYIITSNGALVFLKGSHNLNVVNIVPHEYYYPLKQNLSEEKVSVK